MPVDGVPLVLVAAPQPEHPVLRHLMEARADVSVTVGVIHYAEATIVVKLTDNNDQLWPLLQGMGVTTDK